MFVGAAAAARGAEIGKGLIASMTIGAALHQARRGVRADRARWRHGGGRDGSGPHGTRTERAPESGPEDVARREGGRKPRGGRRSEAVAAQDVPAEGYFAAPRLFEVDAKTFFASPALRHEHFGPVSIVVRCDTAKMNDAAAQFDGQLTATIHADEGDMAWAKSLLPALVEKAGRIVWNGYPTGVAVVPAMHHGGPYPASTNALHTSVGSTAIRRFLRPVVFQNLPESLLPKDLV